MFRLPKIGRRPPAISKFEADARELIAGDRGQDRIKEYLAALQPGTDEHRAYRYVQVVWPIERARDSIGSSKSPSRMKYERNLEAAKAAFDASYAVEISQPYPDSAPTSRVPAYDNINRFPDVVTLEQLLAKESQGRLPALINRPHFQPQRGRQHAPHGRAQLRSLSPIAVPSSQPDFQILGHGPQHAGGSRRYGLMAALAALTVVASLLH